MRSGFAAAVLIMLVLCGSAAASVGVGRDARAPSLRVNARGDALVSWRTPSGAARSVLVPSRGHFLPGYRFRGRDVSTPTREVPVPLASVVKRTPDGRYWALQQWRQRPGKPVELRLSRWRGQPTSAELAVTCCRLGRNQLEGSAEFQGRPVFGSSPTVPGSPAFHEEAFLQCFGCPVGRGGWGFMVGTALDRQGSFSALIREECAAGSTGRSSLGRTAARPGRRTRLPSPP